MNKTLALLGTVTMLGSAAQANEPTNKFDGAIITIQGTFPSAWVSTWYVATTIQVSATQITFGVGDSSYDVPNQKRKEA